VGKVPGRTGSEAMTKTYDRVVRQMTLVASVDPAEAIEICQSHFSFLVGIISSNCETDQEFINAMAAMAAQAVKAQINHRATLRAKGLLKEEPK
jgi:hypothetical protein